MERSKEVADIIHTIYGAVSSGDADTLSSLLSAREGLVFIGTDPGEWFEDRGAITAMLKAQAGAGVKVRAGSVAAYEEGTVAWVADNGAFILPDGTEMPFRLTAVFHRENGGWKLVQEHASIAVANEDALVEI